MENIKSEELYNKWHEMSLQDLEMVKLAMTKNLVLQAAYHTQQCLEKELKGLYILFANEQARYPSYKENISKSLDAKTITNFINTIHEVYTWRAKKKT